MLFRKLRLVGRSGSKVPTQRTVLRWREYPNAYASTYADAYASTYAGAVSAYAGAVSADNCADNRAYGPDHCGLHR